MGNIFPIMFAFIVEALILLKGVIVALDLSLQCVVFEFYYKFFIGSVIIFLFMWSRYFWTVSFLLIKMV